MSCVAPLPAHYGNLTKNGKIDVVVLARTEFNLSKYSMRVPCGKCIKCKLKRSRVWAIRLMHEASMHEPSVSNPDGKGSCFITLTYNQDNLPNPPTLVKKHFQDFMKRLRYYHPHLKIKYYYCGEYGDLKGRPHFHAILFGINFDHDKYFWEKRNGFDLYRSPTLEKIWKYGYSSVGSTTFESAGYVARYIMKKVWGDAQLTHYAVFDRETGEVLFDRLPEFTDMSNGLGKSWYELYGEHAVRSGTVVMKGMKFSPPKYYESRFEILYPEEMQVIKEKRQAIAKTLASDNTSERLAAKAKIALRKAALLIRGFD